MLHLVEPLKLDLGEINCYGIITYKNCGEDGKSRSLTLYLLFEMERTVPLPDKRNGSDLTI